MGDIRAVVERYWATAQARDWKAFGATLADDVRYELPQTRERVVGRDGVVRFNAEYPGEWGLEVERLVADAEQAVSWILFSADGGAGDGVDGDDGDVPGISFFTFAPDGRIQTITDFWPEAYEPPAGREHLVQRY